MKIYECTACDSKNIKPVIISFKYFGTMVKEVPAVKCLDCGEEMVTSPVMKRLHQLVEAGKDTYTEGPVINIRYGGGCSNAEAH